MQNIALVYRLFGSPVECLRLEKRPLDVLSTGLIRAEMSLSPINPSDLIAVSGVYSHRTNLPLIAGYEGVGRVVETTGAYSGLLGKRVLPLRGPGTWQRYVDCDPALAIVVPDEIEDHLAARAYINPVAALRMLSHWPVKGRRVLLSGSGSTCANLLGQWALAQGAHEVRGIFRSASRKDILKSLGINPISMTKTAAVLLAAQRADVTFDSLGGSIGAAILGAMRPGSHFVGYGLLSGQAIRLSERPLACWHRFHLRDDLKAMSTAIWQDHFRVVWTQLREAKLPPFHISPLHDWQPAIRRMGTPGAPKTVLDLCHSRGWS